MEFFFPLCLSLCPPCLCGESSILRGAQRTAPGPLAGVRGGSVGDSGDDRLSRQGHYHGPDGLNGRVRNGNGWDPVSMFAGKALGRRSSLPSTCQSFTFVWSSRKLKPQFSMGMTDRLRVSSRRVVPVMDGI